MVNRCNRQAVCTRHEVLDWRIVEQMQCEGFRMQDSGILHFLPGGTTECGVGDGSPTIRFVCSIHFP